MLYIIVVIMFIFAQEQVRKRAFNIFWMTHHLYVLLYVLSILHGLARLTAAPRFWLFLIVPGIIYTIDKISTLRTRLAI
jgi:dual oxidase